MSSLRPIHVQRFLALIFLGLGGWCLLFPGAVEALVFRPQFYAGTDASRLAIACFGAQAVLCGIVILTSRFSAQTFLIFGLVGSLPFFGFNYYFYFVKGMFTHWMLLDFVGNLGILGAGLLGFGLSRREAVAIANRGLHEETRAGPARAGVLLYAKNVEKVSSFYEKVLGAALMHADHEHRVLQSPDAQLIIHAIPGQYANSVVIDTPPVPRQEQAIKPFFTVQSLAEAERVAEQCGGSLYGPVWPGPGMRVRNVCDPEGNIVHLRERSLPQPRPQCRTGGS